MCFCNSDVAKLEKIIRTEMAAAVFFTIKMQEKQQFRGYRPAACRRKVCKRPHSALPKTANGAPKGHVLRRKRPPFATRRATC